MLTLQELQKKAIDHFNAFAGKVVKVSYATVGDNFVLFAPAAYLKLSSLDLDAAVTLDGWFDPIWHFDPEGHNDSRIPAGTKVLWAFARCYNTDGRENVGEIDV